MADRRRSAEEVSELQQERIRKTVQAFLQEDTDFSDVDLNEGAVLYDPMRDGTVGWTTKDPQPPQAVAEPQYAPEEGPAGPPQKPPMDSDQKKLRRDILIATYFFVALFLGAIVYLGFFYAKKADGYKSSSYNSKRQGVYAARYQRGDIFSADGVILATTLIEKDGTQTRSYPENRKYAHVVGYSTRGSSAAESLAGSYLMGAHISPLELAKNELTGTLTHGDNAYLTIRSDLQDAAFKALGDRDGAAVVIEVKTGKILAMVSKPDFDPNTIAEDWDKLVQDETSSVLVNRATQGKYPPGSTFKIITALEYLREQPEKAKEFTYVCDSEYRDGEYTIRCSKGISHGEVTLEKAFAKSCNGAFAVIGSELDTEKLYKLCEDFGYNQDFSIGLVYSRSMYVLKDDASRWDVLQTSIGQGQTLTTPMLNCMIAAAVANDGVMVTPYVMDRVENSYGTLVKTWSSAGSTRVMTADEAKTLQKMMRSVVTEGTGDDAEGDNFTVAGKTGSAEWAKGKETHAWFMGYAPYEDPEIAVCVLIEQGGSGGSAAAPAARTILEAYFREKH
ncbi:MAG: penicillin-binding protein 2 [Lachnospiraceae bacterium]|nr:penicillin-binding protein 2 [Lachnospiraceae bacterium]